MGYYIMKLRQLSFIDVIKILQARFITKIFNYKHCIKDRIQCTYHKKQIGLKKPDVYDYGKLKSLLYNQPICLFELCNLYMQHFFDLLGSGWVKNYYGMIAAGLEGHIYNEDHELDSCANRHNEVAATEIAALIDAKYENIDWQLDFKSGYRWSTKTWYKKIEYGKKPGADIKVPWELARMQHLTMLAWAYGSSGDAKYVREFRNEILDFVANNPPRYGVNWVCTMDVGIRVANWLVAYDMFIGFGAIFDKNFLNVFSQSIYEHGLHCYNNLEYDVGFHGNHYLSDIAGLLFAAAHLECNETTNQWLAFAVQELINEMRYQFNEDGSNFEASTSYHQLSTEIMLYSSVLCLTLPENKKKCLRTYNAADHKVMPKLLSVDRQEYDTESESFFPEWFWRRLEKACEFTLYITKPNGEIPQIGDNDSGRFLKLWPVYVKRTVNEAKKIYRNLEGYTVDLPGDVYFDENFLDHRHILGIAGVLFARQDFLSCVKKDNPEALLFEILLGERHIASYMTKQGKKEQDKSYYDGQYRKSLGAWQKNLEQQYGRPQEYIFNGANLTEDLQTYSWPDFGLYLYKSKKLYLLVRCGSIGQCGRGGHAHNDQLGIELSIGNCDIIKDAGTYVYTPLPARRNEFRSTLTHFTPRENGREQNFYFSGGKGLFQIHDDAKAKTLYFNTDGFVGKHSGFKKDVFRLILVESDAIKILDFGTSEKLDITKLYSRGYGKWDS